MMRSLPSRVVLTLAFATTLALPAFAATGNQFRAERTVPVTSVPVLSTTQIDVQELLRQQARAPHTANQAPRILIQNELDGEGGIAPQDELGPPPPSGFAMGSSINAASPLPNINFKGLDDIAMVDSSYIIIPPDVNGVVGRNHVFQNLNNNVRIFDKATGTVLSTVGVNTWWASTGASANNFTDPRSTYDPYNDRYITMVQGDLDKTTANSICLGVSDTNDPTSTWHLVRFSCYENAMYQYADFPVMGFNKNWIAISINMYTSAQTQVRRSVFMVHYPTLLTSHTATVFRADYGTSNVICGAPVITYSATCDTEFVMQRRGTSTYSMDIIAGTGPSAPTYTVGAAITRPGGTWSALGTSNYYPQSAPVSGTSACGSTPCAIERSDDNFRTPPMYRGGSIWTAQQVGLPSTATHVGIQWTQVTTPSGAFVIGGRLQDTLATTTNGRPFYGEPSIAVNKNGDFLLGFTRFSSQMHPGAGYAMHLESDGAGTLRDTVIYKVGDDYYHKTFSTATGRNRWGDFSSTMIDPSDDLTFWTVNEYARARAATDDGNTGSNSSKWSTWWASVTPGQTYTVTATAGAHGSVAKSPSQPYYNSGSTVSVTATPDAGYAFSGWTGDTTATGSPLSLFVSRNWSVTANFVDSQAPAVAVTSPNGAELWYIGTSQNITWNATDNVGVASVDIDLSRDGGSTWESIAAAQPNSGSYAWLVTGAATDLALVRVTAHDAAGNTGSDLSDAVFSIQDAVTGTLSSFSANPVTDGIELRWSLASELRGATINVSRAPSTVGPWTNLSLSQRLEGDQYVAVDGDVSEGVTYWYRLSANGRALSTISGAAGRAITQFALSRIAPNPSKDIVNVEFAVPRAANVNVSVLDVQGRQVATLANGIAAPGMHQVVWSSHAQPGLYFVRMTTPNQTFLKRVAIVK